MATNIQQTLKGHTRNKKEFSCEIESSEAVQESLKLLGWAISKWLAYECACNRSHPQYLCTLYAHTLNMQILYHSTLNEELTHKINQIVRLEIAQS